jgi:hypothetical protein
MSDHIPDINKMVCPHCGLPADRQQNGIQGYRCGSSYEPTFKPQWARSMTCLELQSGQLQERLKRLKKAGDGLAMWVCPEYKSDPANIALKEWTAAKEAKP